MENPVFNNPALNLSEFKKIASYIEEKVGIKMPEQKRLMMQSRLVGRLNALNLNSFKEYIDYIFSEQSGAELVIMIDKMTTNLTEFFRESVHFDFLTDHVLPEYTKNRRNNFKLWSAGCSTGQEAYTLSIVMAEFARMNPSAALTYKILATDVSTQVLAKARNAVYPLESVQKLSAELKKRYFLKSTKLADPAVRVKPEVRNKVTFKHLNFMDSNFGFRSSMQVIFCRNVLIYFDKPTQKKVLSKFMDYLEKGGYLFLGHSETIFDMDLPLKTVAPTVFQKI